MKKINYFLFLFSFLALITVDVFPKTFNKKPSGSAASLDELDQEVRDFLEDEDSDVEASEYDEEINDELYFASDEYDRVIMTREQAAELQNIIAEKEDLKRHIYGFFQTIVFIEKDGSIVPEHYVLMIKKRNEEHDVIAQILKEINAKQQIDSPMVANVVDILKGGYLITKGTLFLTFSVLGKAVKVLGYATGVGAGYIMPILKDKYHICYVFVSDKFNQAVRFASNKAQDIILPDGLFDLPAVF